MGKVVTFAAYKGEMPEWSIGAVSKTVVRFTADRGFESLSLRTGQKLGIGAFALFYCGGSNRGAPATSSRAERAIPLSPHRAKVRNWGFCLFSLLGFEPRSASNELASGAGNPSLSAQGKS